MIHFVKSCLFVLMNLFLCYTDNVMEAGEISETTVDCLPLFELSGLWLGTFVAHWLSLLDSLYWRVLCPLRPPSSVNLLAFLDHLLVCCPLIQPREVRLPSYSHDTYICYQPCNNLKCTKDKTDQRKVPDTVGRYR